MTGTPDLAAVLDEERKRAAREAKPPKEETPEHRARRLATSSWGRNREHAWWYQHLMTDDEPVWFVTVSNAPKKTGDDAVRMAELQKSLFERWCDQEDRRRRERTRTLAARLRRLGLPVSPHLELYDDSEP